MGQRLGQHFLRDKDVLMSIDMIISDVQKNVAAKGLVEIGPGKGALTSLLRWHADPLIAIEKDEGLAESLDGLIRSGLEMVIWKDVLSVDVVVKEGRLLLDERDVGGVQQFVVVGNLPYYITSPILRQFFVDVQEVPAGVFLIQREVAEKLASTAEKKSFLWRLVNRRYDVTVPLIVSREAFAPPPKVESAVIVLRRKEQDPFGWQVLWERVMGVLDALHGYKRKTLRKIRTYQRERLEELGAVLPRDLEGKRIEELGWGDIGRMLIS